MAHSFELKHARTELCQVSVTVMKVILSSLIISSIEFIFGASERAFVRMRLMQFSLTLFSSLFISLASFSFIKTLLNCHNFLFFHEGSLFPPITAKHQVSGPSSSSVRVLSPVRWHSAGRLPICLPLSQVGPASSMPAPPMS